MNKPLRRVAFGVMMLLVALLVNLTYVQGFQAQELNDRNDNPRVIERKYDRQRGEILVDGRAVAKSVATDDDLKFLRQYSDAKLYAMSTGFDSLVYGQTGVENAADSLLSGDDSRLVVRRAFDLFSGKEPRGGSVALTLNPAAQKAAAAGLGNRRGAVVALDPSTGAILAMVSSPSYDPNSLSSHSRSATTKAWTSLNADERKPMLNRALSETYPPGSTFKLVTAAAALSSGKYQPDSQLPGPARLPLPNTRDASIPNYDNAPCSAGSSTTTLENALSRSCNTTFAQLGLDLGEDALRKQAEAFGFGEALEVPMTTARSVFPGDLDKPATAQSAIGQRDVRATPLQMAMVAAAIANDGVVQRPYLVAEELGPDLSRLGRTRPRDIGRAMSPAVAQQLRDMMVKVVEEGTGGNARIPGIRVGGKTGTAQQGKNQSPHAWFVSFAPADSPEGGVAVAVVIEDGGGADEVSGNQLAAPIANAVMKAVLR